MKRIQRSLLAVLVAGSLAVGMGSPAARAADEAMTRNLESARTLIEKSSAAKRVEASGSGKAAAERERARSLLGQAEKAAAGGDVEKANALLAEAKKTMLRAVQLAGPGSEVTNKAKQDYEMRAASVRALLDAQTRVADEKRAGSGEKAAHDDAESLLAKADARYRKGQYKEGIALLDQALGKLRTSIEHMRGGDTLENRIEFASKADEYTYYWEKTGSQLEAIQLAAKSVAGTPKEKTVKRFAEKMETARGQAKAMAGRGDHAGAVATLEPVFKQAPYQLMSVLN